MKNIECPLCGEKHEVDNTGWVQSCIGYFDLDNFDWEIEKWLKECVQ